ncbi:MAG TPA: alpha/beta fold hydrolase [Acidimicrobiales bacterium]|jgi:2-succinyl-6-hydroxy-2,4-cyclohexadiene-1-carboxylate synthase|nr:alpha/beta fold hydrolase [Acidimicrobiales bacterium]
MLHADVLGTGPRLVLVHGFTQTRRSWGPAAALLGASHELVLVDAPGHGRSGAVRADLWEGGRMIGEVGGRADYLGYSMGGRFLLHLALDHPELVTRLVLVGATAGIEDLPARMERRKGDSEWAELVLTEGVEAFLDRWLAGPLFRGLSPEAAGREARLENTALGLASSLRLAGTGRQEPLWDRLSGLSMPVLLVVGAADDKFRAVAERMGEAIGDNASQAVIEGAGHAAHLEQPAAFADAVRTFLASASASH